ncbi:hypothetical protein PISMIDRAFT_209773 [Pisolithus microcarpus 441]|uniref:Uncharacterized protein n=1 Tax=Pisolithus microcarpus 441 TaxID=765257 RepID=A0A0C9Z676_9AGAM|nr:hypothetical protein PISMIDRAFT_209773 [Pisolithus microcarpus 441]
MVAKQIEIVSQSAVHAVAFVDESQVVAGYDNGDIRRWKIEDGQQLGQTMKGDGAVYSIAVSRDGRWIVSGDQGSKAIVRNALTNEKVRHTQYGRGVYAVDISSDCTKVVAASWGETGNVRLFGISSGTQLLPTVSHTYVCCVKFSPDGSRFATVSCYSGVRVYSTHDGKVLFNSGTQGSTNSSTPLAWSSDGQQLFVASKGNITSFSISDSSSSEWPIHENQSSASIASNAIFIAYSAGSSVLLLDCMSQRQMKKGDYGHAIPLIEGVKNLAPKNKQYPPLMTISLL